MTQKLWHNFSARKSHPNDCFDIMKEVKTMVYTTPVIEKIADYSETTYGAYRGSLADFHRGRLFVWQ